MKKLLLLFPLAIIGNNLYGQSQRLVFVEEFTQASCGPCASANPAFNALLSANTAKAVSLKYQVSWPGTDPMNAQNPAEVATRVTYYGVSGVPDAYMDGNVTSGAPSSITQTGIDNEYAVPASFSIQLDHWFNAANDSIYINCEITCSQNITMTTPRVRVAMMEKTITFSTPPGSNGETVFYNVMRKMYPNANGTSLDPVWTVGQKKTISFKGKIPTYIYSKPEIAVVAWIQDDANKNVKQAAFSPSASSPLVLPPVADFSSDVVSSCDGMIMFQDQSALFPTSWLWDFGDATTSALQNPTHQYIASGTYTVKLTATNASGNNQVIKTSYVSVTLTGTAPTGTNDYICLSGIANLSATASGGGTLNWYNSSGVLVNTGTTYSPNITGTTNFYVAEMTPNAIITTGATDNTIGGGAGAYFTANTIHGLYFNILKPCTLISVKMYANTAGNRTIEVLDAAGVAIQSAVKNLPVGLSTVTLNFTLPAGTGFLIKIATGSTVDVWRNSGGAAYPYTTSVVTITGNTAAGNPTYYYFFYDWNVQQYPCASPSTIVSGIDSCASGIADVSVDNSLSAYPNPSNGTFTVNFQTTKKDNYTVKLTNTIGQIVYEESLNNFSGTYSMQMNVSSYGKGVYMLSVSEEGDRRIGGKNEITSKAVVY